MSLIFWSRIWHKSNPCSADEIQQGSKALADVLEIDLPMLKKMKPKDAAPPAGPSACDRCGRVVYG